MIKQVMPFVVGLFLCTTLQAQVPKQINYQGIARNAYGTALSNQNITLRISIREGSATGTVVYSERRNVTTNQFGLFSTAIGSEGASNITGTLAGVSWSAAADKFVQIEMDPRGGTNFVSLGSSPLTSVPYAFRAETASPEGAAGGDLAGSFPNPTVKDGIITAQKLGPGAVTSDKLADGSVTLSKLAPGVIIGGGSGSPTGAASGDLTGNYPNPAIAANAVNSTKLANDAVTTAKVADGAITAAKLAPGVIPAIPTSLPPSGAAGGSLSGTYPNPGIAANAIGTANIADGSITAAKLAPGAIPPGGGGSPTGAAGGDLSGAYPNPAIAANAVTAAKLADNAVTTSKIVDANVTSVKLADNAVTTGKIADGAVTTAKIPDGSITAAKLAPGAIPPSGGGSPTGTAGGDLAGSYPSPTIAANAVTAAKLADNAVSTNKIVDANVTNPKLANNAVSTAKIADAAITSAKIADGAIIASKIPDGSITSAKLASGIPISGTAGGDLAGTYPNPTIVANAVTAAKLADNAVTTNKIVDANVTNPKLANNAVSTAKIADNAVTGAKVADAAITNTKIADGAVTTSKIPDGAVTTAKIPDGSITAAKLAPGAIPPSGGGSPTGAAGGDLAGSYPSPTIAANAVTAAKLADNAVSTNKIVDANVTNPKLANNAVSTAKIADNAVTGAKVADAAITSAKIADGAIIASKIPDGSITSAKLASGIPISGTAGGDLAGTYPNPTIAANAVTAAKLADNAVSTNKIVDANVTNPKLANNAVSTAKIADAAITSAKIADGAIIASKIPDGSITSAKLASGIPISGTAGGDLAGTYPNPTIAANAVVTAKLADNAVATSKIADAAVTTAKIADGSITAAKLATPYPTSLPPSGAAAGDLSGTYPNPTVSRLNGIAFAATAPASGQVLKYNGSQWAPAADNAGAGGLTFPFSASENQAGPLFSLTNAGAGIALVGTNSNASANAHGVSGVNNNATPSASTAGVSGMITGAPGGNGYGVYGSHSGAGVGVYGRSLNGNGLSGNSTSGNGVFARSTSGYGISASSSTKNAGYFDVSNDGSIQPAVYVSNQGSGGIFSMSQFYHAIEAAGMDEFANAIYAEHYYGGEGIAGKTESANYAAIAGNNFGTYAGVKGLSAAGIGLLGETETGTALVASLPNAGSGTLAAFQVNGTNVARIDASGKGFFNGGTQAGGADVAEYFSVEGNRNNYEPGDVLEISTDADRKVVKSSKPYSNLVAGVIATKPGLLLTEEDAVNSTLLAGVPMGVIGVIPTKVTTEGGVIRRGDFLVSSSTPGAAMKADLDKVKVGQVIGKALQGYEGGTVGLINVLVSVK